MPPAAISSSVFTTIARAASPSRRSRNSSAGAFGNFGALPQPPYVGSNVARRLCSAATSTESVSGSFDGRSSAEWRTASTSCAAARETSSRRSRHASAIESSTWRKLGIPCRGSGG